MVIKAEVMHLEQRWVAGLDVGGSVQGLIEREPERTGVEARVGAHLVIDLWSEDESGEDWEGVDPGALSALVPIRNELMAGDYRALYLAWRLRVQAGEIDGDARTPPAPNNTHRLTGSQQALVEFLRIDLA